MAMKEGGGKRGGEKEAVLEIQFGGVGLVFGGEEAGTPI